MHGSHSQLSKRREALENSLRQCRDLIPAEIPAHMHSHIERESEWESWEAAALRVRAIYIAHKHKPLKTKNTKSEFLYTHVYYFI